MAISSERSTPALARSKKGAFRRLIDAVYWTCYGLVALLLVLSFNAWQEDQTMATSPSSDAVVKRVFRKRGRSHPLYVGVGFPREPGSSSVCDVDVHVEDDQANMSVGDAIRVVRTTSGCDAPLLVGHVPSVEGSLAAALVAFLSGLSLFYLRRSLAERPSPRA